jgi:C-terminal processing protease CtpA/Prc
MTGATYSHGFPITPVELLRDISPTSVRPCVLITDPLCYSATDMFAAGFQDHGIGTIIGVGGATGAGGANVWSHGLLRQLLPPDAAHQSPTRYQPLPRGADLRVAIRRTTRVADNPGDVLEDLGVTPDIVYQMTAGDILEGNVDLINRAIEVIASHQIDPTSNAT